MKKSRGAQHLSASENTGVWTLIRDFFTTVIIALLISTLLRIYILQIFWIPSPSMHNTLMENDRIAVSRFSAWTDSYQRGDVVVFNDGGSWLESDKSRGMTRVLHKAGEFVGILPAGGEKTLVKRIIGVGGDHVTCCTVLGRVSVNGVAIEEPYVADGQAPSQVPFDVTVPDGYVWVMGDNRKNSSDSRYHMKAGQHPFVLRSDIVGRVQWVVWPFGHWKSVGDHDAFADVPDNPSLH